MTAIGDDTAALASVIERAARDALFNGSGEIINPEIFTDAAEKFLQDRAVRAAPATDTTAMADRIEGADTIGLRFVDMRGWHYLTPNERALIVAALRTHAVRAATKEFAAETLMQICEAIGCQATAIEPVERVKYLLAENASLKQGSNRRIPGSPKFHY